MDVFHQGRVCVKKVQIRSVEEGEEEEWVVEQSLYARMSNIYFTARNSESKAPATRQLKPK